MNSRLPYFESAAQLQYQFQNVDCSDAIPMCCLTLIRPDRKRKKFPVQYSGCAAISPSKKQAAYREGNTLMVWDVERDGVVYTLPLLSYEQGNYSVFLWSSDNRKIAFTVVEGGCGQESLMGTSRLIVFGADGKKAQTLILPDDAWLENYDFTEDSKKLYYIQHSGKKKTISLQLPK